MGWTWEVSVWERTPAGYDYRKVYQGESTVRALLAAWRAKHSDITRCVKVQWR